MARWSALDLVEAYQLGHAVGALHELDLMAHLARPITARALARRAGLDERMLRGVLELVAARTALVRRTGDRFAATAAYTGGARYLVELYAGAFARTASELPRVLRDPARAARTVDRRRHARAFAAAGDGATVLPALIAQLGCSRVLDVGCGSAAMLVEAARRDPALIGWGLEPHAAMRRVAQARIRTARLGRRLRVLAGGCDDLGTAVPADVRARVELIALSQVANEMFRDGGARFTRWLRAARRWFPRRLLVVADYYGRLGHAPAGRETLLHDYVQLASGQGIPPPTARAWSALYTAARCRLVHALDDRATTQFVHLVQL